MWVKVMFSPQGMLSYINASQWKIGRLEKGNWIVMTPCIPEYGIFTDFTWTAYIMYNLTPLGRNHQGWLHLQLQALLLISTTTISHTRDVSSLSVILFTVPSVSVICKCRRETQVQEMENFGLLSSPIRSEEHGIPAMASIFRFVRFKIDGIVGTHWKRSL